MSFLLWMFAGVALLALNALKGATAQDNCETATLFSLPQIVAPCCEAMPAGDCSAGTSMVCIRGSLVHTEFTRGCKMQGFQSLVRRRARLKLYQWCVKPRSCVRPPSRPWSPIPHVGARFSQWDMCGDMALGLNDDTFGFSMKLFAAAQLTS